MDRGTGSVESRPSIAPCGTTYTTSSNFASWRLLSNRSFHVPWTEDISRSDRFLLKPTRENEHILKQIETKARSNSLKPGDVPKEAPCLLQSPCIIPNGQKQPSTKHDTGKLFDLQAEVSMEDRRRMAPTSTATVSLAGFHIFKKGRKCDYNFKTQGCSRPI